MTLLPSSSSSRWRSVRQPRPGLLPPEARRAGQCAVRGLQVPLDARRPGAMPTGAARPRATTTGSPRVGRIIRATSVDELPQLLNVLLGSMSIVGPRPHALGSLAGQQLFWEVDERYWHRHVLKPGITGLAQVRGFRGATHLRSDLTQRLHADLEYVVDWSVLRDLAILISTFRVLVHRNAF
ncbi:sugar transferase [Sphingomonas sp. MMS24-JH45]